MVDRVTTIFKLGVAVEQTPLVLNKMFPSLTGYKIQSEAYRSILEYLLEVVKQHEANLDPDNPQDFIDLYLTEIIGQNSGEDYNVPDLVACIYDFFLAGTETSSTTLKWIVLYLTTNENVQDR